MQEITSDVFYDHIDRYDPNGEDHYVGEVEYHLLCDDKPYEGMESHREALNCVFDRLVKMCIEEIEIARRDFGDGSADRMHPWVYDIDKAEAVLLDPEVFFYCPEIVKVDYYGNVFYDAEWKPDNCGTSVPYWYALMEPVQGRRNKPEDFKKVNEALFPNGIHALDIFEWTTDWSDYFDAGHEWYGSCCWSIYDREMDRYAVLLVSATD